MGRDIDKGSWINDEVYQRVNANDWTVYCRDHEPQTLFAAGLNSSGQLGQNNVIYKSSPVQITGTEWGKISCHSTT